MATAVFFHAHPDDEALFTGGTMARAAAEGHRVVLVTATGGDRGGDRGRVVGLGETLAEHRGAELKAAADALDAHRCQMLGYLDSGRDGAAADGFCHQPPDQAGRRLADILVEEAADVLVTYDERGIYGHPDHIQAHRVAIQAADLANTPTAFLATVDRDYVASLLALAPALGLSVDDDIGQWADAGVAGGRITVAVDVTKFLDAKRNAMAAHQSQIGSASPLLALSSSTFQLVFGVEWYIEVGVEPGVARRTWLFP